jgi:asparaginyl-tRNA synthetase
MVAINSRVEKKEAVLKVRAKVLEAARSWLNLNSYVEVQGPTLVPALSETPFSFEVRYFSEKAYLNQGLQPYSDFFVRLLGKVYTVAPVFRAETCRTGRHLAEYWRIEVADSSRTLNGIIEVQENLLKHICRQVAEGAFDELRVLHRSADELAKLKVPFPRLTYDEAIRRLQAEGCRINWGEELSWNFEKLLSLSFDQPFFITNYPVSIHNFFFKSLPGCPELSLTADLIVSEGYGEIASSGEIENSTKLLRKMKMEKVEPEIRRWYMSFRRDGFVSYSGFALGLERLILWLCKLGSIEEAIAFPRTFENFYP